MPGAFFSFDDLASPIQRGLLHCLPKRPRVNRGIPVQLGRNSFKQLHHLRRFDETAVEHRFNVGNIQRVASLDLGQRLGIEIIMEET